MMSEANGAYLRHLRGRPSLCALLYLSVHQGHEVRCIQGGGVMKVSVLYLVTQSRGQFRLPVFFSPDLGRPAACRLQALLSPPTCSEGAEIRSLSSETLSTSAFSLPGRFLPVFWTHRDLDRVRNVGIDSGL